MSSAPLLTAMLDHVRVAAHRRSAQGPDRQAVEVEVDLAGVTFADSSGLAPVLDSRTRVVAASSTVRHVLRLLADLPSSRAAPARG